jgi:3alpha(or 20beta)-hydroxysteroid dehydrogenase
VFLGLKHVLPTLIGQGQGSVINSSSGAGLGGAPNLSPYVASKHAVQGITRVAALEVADKGIRVNSINPGPIRSRMIDSLDSRSGVTEAEGAAAIPFGRYGLPEEVAALVAFLGSDDARYITGTHNLIDGGRSAML